MLKITLPVSGRTMSRILVSPRVLRHDAKNTLYKREKTVKLDFIEIENFCILKDIIFLRFYLFLRGRAQAGGGAEGEAGSLLSREPDMGLDPRTPGS